MSDVHCPATFLLACPGQAASSEGVVAMTWHGRTEARRLAALLTDRRLALVYAGHDLAAVQTAEVVAGALGLHVRVSAALAEAYDAGGESARRRVEELEEIADAHRGETVLVVAGRDVLRSVVPRLAPGLAEAGPLAPDRPVELAVDADGWVLRSSKEGVQA